MHFISLDDIELDNGHVRIDQVLTFQEVQDIINEVGIISVTAINPTKWEEFL